jgi:hypothetical protein
MTAPLPSPLKEMQRIEAGPIIGRKRRRRRHAERTLRLEGGRNA